MKNLALAMLLLFVGRAVAAEILPSPAAKAEAKNLLDVGLEAWERGEYLAALDDFQRAYALYPSPNLRFNIARVLTDLGRDIEALEAFESFVANAHNAPEGTLGVAKAKIAVLEQRIGRIALHSPAPDATIALDGRSVAVSPIDKTIRVVPGMHQITGQRPGYLDYLTSVSVMPQQTQRVSVDFRSVARAQPLVKRWWFWTALGGAAAVVATGIGVGVVYGSHYPQPGLGSTTLSTRAAP